MECLTVGWVICRDARQITVTQTKGAGPGSEEFTGTMSIPLPWVLGEVELLTPEP